MRFVDLVSLILYNLGRRKGRVLLTAIGVVIGTAAVVVLVSLVVGLQKNATESLWGINDLTVLKFIGLLAGECGSQRPWGMVAWAEFGDEKPNPGLPLGD
jgi:putative ABC transport system permease protein